MVYVNRASNENVIKLVGLEFYTQEDIKNVETFMNNKKTLMNKYASF